MNIEYYRRYKNMSITKKRKEEIKSINLNRNISRKGAEGTQKTNSANAGTKPLGVKCRCGCDEFITTERIDNDDFIWVDWLSSYANGIWMIKSHLFTFKEVNKSMSCSKSKNIKLRFMVSVDNVKLLAYIATLNDYNVTKKAGQFIEITSRVFTNRSGVNKHASGFVAYNSDMKVDVLDENENLITTEKAGNLAATLKKIR